MRVGPGNARNTGGGVPVTVPRAGERTSAMSGPKPVSLLRYSNREGANIPNLLFLRLVMQFRSRCFGLLGVSRITHGRQKAFIVL